ncbi:MAG TPA: hypothetical protein PKD70_11190 [Saprospiraceae bacterium]|nr:hypothetical protein [Saprospiraceae bacterium]HMP14436.1 hypothetical protein [Saprospiraceae bacterium]
MNITVAQIKRLHALLNELNLINNKQEMILAASGGRTSSSKGLTEQEAQFLIESLQAEKDNTVGRMRKKIIHLLCLLGYVMDDGQPNMRRIQHFVQHRTGQNNPKKNLLHKLTVKEAIKVLNQVTVFYNKELKRQANATKRTNQVSRDDDK